MLGGVHETFQVKNPEVNEANHDSLWEILYRSFLMKSICNASIEIKDEITPGSVEVKGLVLG